MNTAQMRELMKMQNTLQDVFGFSIIEYTDMNHEGKRNFASMRVRGVVTEMGTVEFVLDTFLDEIGQTYSGDKLGNPLMVMMPRNMIGFYQDKFSDMDSNMRVKESVSSSMRPTLEMKDVTIFSNYQNGGNECYDYRGNIRFYIVL
jgi:hypothetical protein